MQREAVRERVREEKPDEAPVGLPVLLGKQQPQARKPVGWHKVKVKKRLAEHKQDKRFQAELKEMKETHDLDEVDDDVEVEATLYEWRAKEHEHRPKSPLWYAGLAAGTTVVVGLQALWLANYFGAVVIAVIGAALYYVAQQKPAMARYRIMIDGVAINNVLYHYQDLESFNVIYEAGVVMMVIFRSKRRLAPYIHMEFGSSDANPVEVRDILLQYLEEDQEMGEPVADLIARKLGF